jgi:hypothetical protein
MRSKTLIVLGAVAILGASSAAMAKSGGGMHMHGHGHHFVHHHFVHSFRFRNPLFLSGWGWGGDWGWGGYGNSGGGNTIVVVFPQAIPQAAQAIPQAAHPQAAHVTSSVDPAWDATPVGESHRLADATPVGESHGLADVTPVGQSHRLAYVSAAPAPTERQATTIDSPNRFAPWDRRIGGR